MKSTESAVRRGPRSSPLHFDELQPHQISPEEFKLEPLKKEEPKTTPAKRTPKKRRQPPIDENTALTDEQMRDQMDDYSSTVKTMQTLREEALNRRLTPQELMNPRPRHLKGLSEELLVLFDSVLLNIRERPLTFEEAVRTHDFEQLRRRRFASHMELPSWNSEQVYDEYNADEPSMLRSTPDHKISSSIERILQTPTSERAELPRPSSISGAFAEEMGGPTLFAEEMGGPVFGDYEPMERDGSSLLGLGVRLTDTGVCREEPPTLMPETQALFDQIAGSGEKETKFDTLLPPGTTKQQAAKKFFVLLNLLKHQKVKVRQTEAYGEIKIKLKT